MSEKGVLFTNRVVVNLQVSFAKISTFSLPSIRTRFETYVHLVEWPGKLVQIRDKSMRMLLIYNRRDCRLLSIRQKRLKTYWAEKIVPQKKRRCKTRKTVWKWRFVARNKNGKPCWIGGDRGAVCRNGATFLKLGSKRGRRGLGRWQWNAMVSENRVDASGVILLWKKRKKRTIILCYCTRRRQFVREHSVYDKQRGCTAQNRRSAQFKLPYSVVGALASSKCVFDAYNRVQQ